MTKSIKTIAIIALATLAVFAGRKFHTADAAALNCPEVRQYVSQDYIIDSVIPNMNRFVTEPVGTYNWGTVTVQMHKNVGGHMSLTTESVTARCYIRHSKNGNKSTYDVTGVEITTNTVY